MKLVRHLFLLFILHALFIVIPTNKLYLFMVKLSVRIM